MADSERLLGSYLDKTRMERDVRQYELAKAAKVSDSYVSQVLAGTAVPSDERLAAFARVLNLEDCLPQLLLRAAHDRLPASPETAQIRLIYLHLVQQLDADAAKSGTPVAIRTLEYFPRAFQPMVIVTGDKREDPPKTPGDVGALSASPMDDRYLNAIPLPDNTEKISDKVFVVADEAYLRERFGHTNLFVIGSPASNHLARKINQHALFKFAFEQGTVEDIEGIVSGGIAEMRNRAAPGLKTYRDEKMRDLKFIMNEFKQGGIFDPLPKGRNLRARSLRGDVDFATITIATNPCAESDEFVAIMAAGFHLPGTVHAVKLLSQPSKFTAHPFGGVLEVRMSEAVWHERIAKADAQWDTEDYQAGDMIPALKRVGEKPDWPMSAEEARRLIELVDALSPSPKTAGRKRAV